MTDGALAPKRTSIEYSSSSRSMSVHRAASSRPSCGACMSRCNDMAADCQTPPNTMALGFDGCLHRQQHVKAIGGEDMKRCRGYLVVRSVCGGIFCLGKSRRYRHHFSISIVSHIHRHFARPALRKKCEPKPPTSGYKTPAPANTLRLTPVLCRPTPLPRLES